MRGCPGSGNETINNNISGTTVATFEPGALGAGSGPVIVTSDLDFFSNFFTGSSIGPNRTFALNAFAWMMDNIAPAKIPDTYFPLTNPIRVYDSRISGGPIASGSSRAVKVAGGRLKLCGINPLIMDVFKITRFDRLFEIHDEEWTAIDSFESSSADLQRS